ncbi:MAG: hypothetical protein ACE363_14785 [Alphaproteobacteria bacterium]
MKETPPPGDLDLADERDAPLSLWWESIGRTAELIEAFDAQNIGTSKNKRTVCSMALSLTREAIGQGRAVSYSRRKEWYVRRPAIYRNPLYTYGQITKAADFLAAQGLVEHFKAPPRNYGYQSTIRARPELVELTWPILADKVRIVRPASTIWLKDENKDLISFAPTGRTGKMQRELDAQNEAILSIDFGGTLPGHSFLVRIFNNGSFSQGGRAYALDGAWQTLPEEERKRLIINGEPVVEIDYVQLHAALAYMKLGIAAPLDAYTVIGYPRDLVKIAFNVMLNCQSPTAARRSLAQKPILLDHLLQAQGANADAYNFCGRLVEAIENRHAPISSLFYSGVGLALQRVDSEMAGLAMRDMRKRGVPVLPVHDSLIMPASAENFGHEAMEAAAQKMGVHANLKVA